MNKKRIERALGRLLFVFASRLPESTSPVNFGAKRFRALCGRLIMKSCGENGNIEKGAFFASDTCLGNKSGIGAFSIISNTTVIGNNVMMARECIINPSNHKMDGYIPSDESTGI